MFALDRRTGDHRGVVRSCSRRAVVGTSPPFAVLTPADPGPPLGLDAVGTGLPAVMWAVILGGAFTGLSAAFFFKVEDARLHMIEVLLLAVFLGGPPRRMM
jgi:hypothetical protein